MKNTNSASLKVFGIIAIVFAVIYAVIGTLALMGTMDGVLPGHEKQEILLIILAYGVALFALICGVACVKGNTGLAKVCGVVFAAAGILSLAYMQITQDTFSILVYCLDTQIDSLRSEKLHQISLVGQ